MEFKIVINKVHLIMFVALIVLVGFVFAQTPTNPGHPADQVFIGGIVNEDLQGWGVRAETRLDGLDTSIISHSNFITNHEQRLYNLEHNVIRRPGTNNCGGSNNGLACHVIGSEWLITDMFWNSNMWVASCPGTHCSSPCDWVLCTQ